MNISRVFSFSSFSFPAHYYHVLYTWWHYDVQYTLSRGLRRVRALERIVIHHSWVYLTETQIYSRAKLNFLATFFFLLLFSTLSFALFSTAVHACVNRRSVQSHICCARVICVYFSALHTRLQWCYGIASVRPHKPSSIPPSLHPTHNNNITNWINRISRKIYYTEMWNAIRRCVKNKNMQNHLIFACLNPVKCINMLCPTAIITYTHTNIGIILCAHSSGLSTLNLVLVLRDHARALHQHNITTCEWSVRFWHGRSGVVWHKNAAMPKVSSQILRDFRVPNTANNIKSNEAAYLSTHFIPALRSNALRPPRERSIWSETAERLPKILSQIKMLFLALLEVFVLHFAFVVCEYIQQQKEHI